MLFFGLKKDISRLVTKIIAKQMENFMALTISIERLTALIKSKQERLSTLIDLFKSREIKVDKLISLVLKQQASIEELKSTVFELRDSIANLQPEALAAALDEFSIKIFNSENELNRLIEELSVEKLDAVLNQIKEEDEAEGEEEEKDDEEKDDEEEENEEEEEAEGEE
jgi:hypothetical protein